MVADYSIKNSFFFFIQKWSFFGEKSVTPFKTWKTGGEILVSEKTLLMFKNNINFGSEMTSSCISRIKFLI